MSNSIETRCVHGAAHQFRENSSGLTMPIYQTAAFSHTKLGHNDNGFDYTRLSNPTRSHLEETVSALESAADTVAFSSGMAAIAAVCELFRPGDKLICSADLYGGTVLLFRSISEKNGLEIVYVDTTDASLVAAAVDEKTKAIYIETPSNPMMNVTDIRACAAIAREAGAMLIVDNTFLSPYFQNPIPLGADIVIHSGTKYLAGHNDTISGFACTATAELGEKIRKIAVTIGSVLAPFDSWLTERGIKTLAVRMERQQENAMAIANWLKQQPQVKAVYYVGLPEHPGYAVNASQARGAGGMLSFTMESPELALQVLQKVKVITFAESLGGPESLITLPATQTHRDVEKEVREALGITDAFLRMSVGLENAQDLIDDLKQAMK
ncbi:MAG: PLP-dependent transferase [Oscillospiraceae bacterium]|nr:PLP-dependent transferase [Oscillospiraceae bacterium]